MSTPTTAQLQELVAERIALMRQKDMSIEIMDQIGEAGQKIVRALPTYLATQSERDARLVEVACEMQREACARVAEDFEGQGSVPFLMTQTVAPSLESVLARMGKGS